MRTHCTRGHELTPDNVDVRIDGRRCKKCRSINSADKGRFTAHRTHCRRGHELTEDNVYVRANGTRRCRVCRHERDVDSRKPVTGRTAVIDIASRPSDDLIAEARRRALAPYRDLAGEFFNDPPVGFSALDRRQSV